MKKAVRSLCSAVEKGCAPKDPSIAAGMVIKDLASELGLPLSSELRHKVDDWCRQQEEAARG